VLEQRFARRFLCHSQDFTRAIKNGERDSYAQLAATQSLKHLQDVVIHLDFQI